MNGYKEIDAATLFEMMANEPLTLVDVRNDDEVARGIIPGALHIQLATIPANYEVLDQQKSLVFYCHSGIRSGQASAFLASKGYKSVYNLQGGILAWGRAGYSFVPK